MLKRLGLRHKSPKLKDNAGIAQGKSQTLPTFWSRVRISLSAPNSLYKQIEEYEELLSKTTDPDLRKAYRETIVDLQIALYS